VKIVNYAYARMFVELFVTDAEIMARFFEQALGFTRGYTLVEADGLDFAVLHHTTLVAYVHRMLRTPEQQRLEKTVRIYLEPDDLPAQHAHLQRLGYSPTPIEDAGYGADVFHLIGPDEYEFVFQKWR
jgi:hypothetical protein